MLINFLLSGKDLVACLLDIFVAGTETSASTIRSAILFLVLNPHVQDKIHQEIDEYIPRDSIPAFEHKNK